MDFLFVVNFLYLHGCKFRWFCYCYDLVIPIYSANLFRFRVDEWHNCRSTKNSLVLVVVTFGLYKMKAKLRDLAFLVLDFLENIQGHFFDYHFGIGAIQSVVFCAVDCFWPAVKYSEKDS